MTIATQTVRTGALAPAPQNPFGLAIAGIAGRNPGADADLRALQEVGQKVRVFANETIFNEGDEAEFCYKVVSGAVRLCKHMSDGRRQIADFLLAGDFFGFLQFEAYGFTAEAVGEVVLMRYPQGQVERLRKSMPSMDSRMMTVLSQRLRDMQNHLVMLGRQTAKERVASILLQLGERSEAEEDVAFDVPMCRQDIADYLGLTVETVCRSLSELKRARLIGIPVPNQIVLKDIETLYAIADGEE
jgi:CRP-like cAMP-binding protein